MQRVDLSSLGIMVASRKQRLGHECGTQLKSDHAQLAHVKVESVHSGVRNQEEMKE